MSRWEYAVQVLSSSGTVLYIVTTMSGSREAALATLQSVREKQVGVRARDRRTARLVRRLNKWEVCK